MNTSERILVIILASFLAIFLALAITLLVKLIQVTKQLKEIADKAREVADNVESASEMFKKTAGPLALGRFFVNIADTVMKHKKGK